MKTIPFRAKAPQIGSAVATPPTLTRPATFAKTLALSALAGDNITHLA